MSDMQTGILQPLIILAIFLLLFAYVIPFISVLFTLLRVATYQERMRPLEGIPMLSPLRQVAMRELEALGFKPVMAYAAADDALKYSGMLMRHANDSTFATLSFKAQWNAGFTVNFYSFQEGPVLVTVNRLPLLLPYPEMEVTDPNAGSLEKFWQAHENRLKGRQLLTLEDNEVFSRIAAVKEHYFTYQCGQGRFIRDRHGDWFPTFRAALDMTLALWRTRRPRLRPYQTVLTAEPYQGEFYAECYREQEMVKKRTKSRPLLSLALLVFSIAASIVVWAWYRDWVFAAIIVAVLLIHESGHALAMRIFGYSNMNMFFLPMMGAIVTGSAKNISAWKQAIILFAGPMPGLLFGIWVMDTHTPLDSSVTLNAGLTAFIVNLFNLLPITPLDGGRLIEISLFARWPYAMLFFAALSFLAAVGIWLLLKSTTVFVIAYFIYSYAMSQWRMIRVRRQWKGEPGQDDQLPALFDATRKITGNKPFLRQYYIVKSIFIRPTVNLPRLWESLIVLVIFALLWVVSFQTLLHWRPA